MHIYDDIEYDTFKNTSCVECADFKICSEIFNFDKIDECMEGTELAEYEQEQKDKRVC